MIQSLEEGRKEDGNRSIADKIIKRLHDLDKTIEHNQGRWAWELLQNAKDSTVSDENHEISVQIILDNNQVEFKHNGIHFTEKDIRGLINQISSKEVEENEQTRKTGRFGTGFLTTHLLSRVIQIRGVLKSENEQFYRFKFPLDRTGKTMRELAPKIETAWSKFHNSVLEVNHNDYNINEFNTSFCYSLITSEQQEVAKTGIDEFTKLLPYVLAFIPKIKSIQIIDNTRDTDVLFLNNNNRLDEFITLIERIENNIKSNIYILNYSGDKSSIACELEKENDKYFFKNLENLPKLFCDFPLIGLKIFTFQ
tara:strand:- start:43527 stop:44453 length:927 start_codon:yes stop_codon:yes gene_type:complete